jgi:hypothetical protein
MARLVIPSSWSWERWRRPPLVLGALAAWYETEILLGSLPAGRTLIAIATGALLEFFVVALVVFAVGWSKNFIQAAVLAVVLFFTMPALGPSTSSGRGSDALAANPGTGRRTHARRIRQAGRGHARCHPAAGPSGIRRLEQRSWTLEVGLDSNL